MEQVSKRLSCAEANKMDMVDYLSTIGIEPAKIKGNEYWYLSPLRDENSPSFKIDRKLNRWYDHGDGKGGKLVDFAVDYYHCNVGELLRKLSGNLSLPIPNKRPANITQDDSNHIEVTGVKPLTNPALLQYAESRAIPKDLIQKYCSEVNYKNGDKSYFAIGFKNDLGGYELRSKYFKGSSSPKGFTHLKNGHSNLTVFEGFFSSFLFKSFIKTTPLSGLIFLFSTAYLFLKKRGR